MREKQLNSAFRELAEAGEITKRSGIYETKPWGNVKQSNFFNMCIEFRTTLNPQELLTKIKNVEVQLGRVKREKWGPREIDIDILFYEDQIISDPELTIPHKYLHERAFVLIPLAEIAPNLVHPILRASISELAKIADKSDVKLLTSQP